MNKSKKWMLITALFLMLLPIGYLGFWAFCFTFLRFPLPGREVGYFLFYIFPYGALFLMFTGIPLAIWLLYLRWKT